MTAPGTLSSYLTSLEKFLTFVTSDRYLRKEMPPLCGNYLEIFKGTINALKGWRATVDNETKDVQHRGHLKECDTLLTQQDIAVLEQSDPTSPAGKPLPKQMQASSSPIKSSRTHVTFFSLNLLYL